MSGKGSDVIINPSIFSNIDKVMNAGIFMDLLEILDVSDLDIADYNQTLLFSSSINNELPVIPLYFTQPLILTLDETLADFRIDEQSMSNIESMLKYFEDIQANDMRLFSQNDLEFTFIYLSQFFFPEVLTIKLISCI